jgi:hypothetical protein
VRQQAAICARKGTSTALKAQAQAGVGYRKFYTLMCESGGARNILLQKLKLKSKLPPTEIKIENQTIFLIKNLPAKNLTNPQYCAILLLEG